MKRKFSVSLFSCLWFTALLLLDAPFVLPLTAAVAIHETGHLLCAAFLKVKITGIRISMLGARIDVDPSSLSYGREFALALCGPLAGIIGHLILYPLSSPSSSLSSYFFNLSAISLTLSLFNLLPVDSLDGGRMLRCALSRFFSPDLADRAMKLFTFASLLLLWLISVYMMLKIVSGLPLFIFSAILFLEFFIFKSKKRD